MNTQQPWHTYTGSSSVILTVILLIVTGVLILFAARLPRPITFKRPGKVLCVSLVLLWFLCGIAVLVASYIYIVAEYRQEGGHLTVAADPVTPVTYTSAVVAFLVIAYLSRRSRFWIAFGSAIVGTIAAPMIFELPFDLIIIGRISPPPPGTSLLLIFFTSFILFQILSCVMLTLSPVLKLSRYSLFLLAGMFLIFAVWAVFGFAYPASPLPIALNMISKVLAFATTVTLFLPTEKSVWFVRQPVPDRKKILNEREMAQ